MVSLKKDFKDLFFKEEGKSYFLPSPQETEV